MCHSSQCYVTPGGSFWNGRGCIQPNPPTFLFMWANFSICRTFADMQRAARYGSSIRMNLNQLWRNKKLLLPLQCYKIAFYIFIWWCRCSDTLAPFFVNLQHNNIYDLRTSKVHLFSFSTLLVHLEPLNNFVYHWFSMFYNYCFVPYRCTLKLQKVFANTIIAKAFCLSKSGKFIPITSVNNCQNRDLNTTAFAIKM